MTRTPEQVLADVEAVTAEIQAGEDALAASYAQRAALFREGRALEPPIQHPLLARAAGVSEVAVQTAIRKAVRAEEDAAAPAASGG